MQFNLPNFFRNTIPTNWRRSDLDNFFDEFSSLINDSWHVPESRQFRVPRIDISEKEDKYLLDAELPGVKQDDLEVQLDNNVLTIKGKTEEISENKDKNYFMRERYYGSFKRSITLPSNIDQEKIEAKFEDGILHMQLPKKDGGYSKKIEVKS